MTSVIADALGIQRDMNGPWSNDPRSVANFMLDEAERDGIPLTNLAIQKLLYFAHAIFLIETKRPLVSGYFEAWQYGPVHPAAYSAFKAAGGHPITFRARRQDVLSDRTTELAPPSDLNVHRHVRRIMTSYGQLTPGRLVEIAHAKGAPWHFIVEKSRTSMAFGLRIPDDVILDRFKHHKVTIGVSPSFGEPNEDTPFA